MLDAIEPPRCADCKAHVEHCRCELVRVVAPHFVAAFVMVDNAVVRTAPILAWAKKKPRHYLRDFFRFKGWTATIVRPTLRDAS